ncbi:MAG: SDR family oxidoreductase [Schleiferiaceae bacterium]
MQKTALITGASSGIGKELAIIHAENGGDLVIVARSEDKLKQLKKEIQAAHKVEIEVVSMDLTQPSAGEDLFNLMEQKNIEIDFLINNAGFGGLGKFHEREWEADHSMIQLNIVALTELTRRFLPGMVARNKGKILNVSSTASLLPGPLQAVYYATKAYVTSFSNAVAEELHDTNVTVTALMPGATETEFGAVSGMDKTDMFKTAASARGVAMDGYQAMLKGKLDVISGLTTAQKVMMATLPFTPKKMVLSQVRKMQEVK